MATDSVVDLPEGVFEDAGRLWKSRAGATSSFEESVAARHLFRELHALEFWNPWEFAARSGELERAQETMGEWERAEPGFKSKSERQLDAEMAEWDREFEQMRAQRETVRMADLDRYDPGREADRLDLLECQSIVAHLKSELARMKSGEAFPAMDRAKRAARVEELDQSLGQRTAEVERLKPLVGNPEDVVDRHGHLPADRRTRMLHEYRERRIELVNDLRAALAELDVQILEAQDRGQRSNLKAERSAAQTKLDRLLVVPPLQADDMCADCPTPADKHGWVTPPADGPCPAWPGWASRLRAVRTMLEQAVERNEARPSASTPAVEQPLAVLPSGLPVAKVIQRLQELQQQFPEAEVRRGRANRWELWPKN